MKVAVDFQVKTTLVILLLSSVVSQAKDSLKVKFEKLEAQTKSQLSLSVMSELGARALFEAKITSINLESLEVGNSVTYFRLNHPQDFCRQNFINGLEYVVHTKCYRQGDVILDFTKSYVK